jgi:amino acid transporter
MTENTAARPMTDTEHGLRKELRLRDLVPMQILMVVGVTWAGIAAKQGSTHPMLWIVGILFYFLPQAAVVTYCARLWPLEGGVYQWAKFAFGPLTGFLTAWNYAFFAVLLVSSLGILTATSLSYVLGPGAAWMAESQPLTLALGGAVLTLIFAANVIGFHYGRWIAHFGAAVMVILTMTFAVLLVWHPAATAAHPHVNPQAPFKFAWPIWTLLTINLYVKAMNGAYSGLEQVAVLAGEVKNAGRAIVLSAWIAAPVIVAIYALMTGSMLSYVPASQIDLAGPIPQVLAAAFGSGVGVWLGRVMIMGLAIYTICAYSVLTAETSRLPMVAGWDSVLPEWFTRLSPRYRTPTHSLLVIVGVAAVFSILASLGTARQEAYQLLITTGQISYGLYYCTMFAVPLFAGSRFGSTPGFWLKACALSGMITTAANVVFSLAPIVDVNSSWGFAAKVGGTALAVNLTGAAIYWQGRQRALRRRVSLRDDPTGRPQQI